MTPEFTAAALILLIASYLMYKIGWKAGFQEGIGGTLMMLSRDDLIKVIFDSDGKITHIMSNDLKPGATIQAVSDIEKNK
jgi:hypothetical protein